MDQEDKAAAGALAIALGIIICINCCCFILVVVLNSLIVTILCGVCLSLCLNLFNLVWICIGGYLLFQSDNMNSCKDGSDDAQSLWIASLVFWLLNAVGMIIYCCAARTNQQQQ